MFFRECCKSCQYSMASKSSLYSWCILRKIKVDSEISPYAFCHHWNQKESFDEALSTNNLTSQKQLDFDRELVFIDS